MPLATQVNSLATAVGTAVKNRQPKSSILTGLSALTHTTDQLPFMDAGGVWGLTSIPGQARGFLGQSSQVLQRNYLDVYSRAEAAALFPGSEMGYIERTSNFTTTNTTMNTTSTSLITGLSLTVIGEGKPVAIEFEGSIQSSVANAVVAVYLVSNSQFTTAPGGYIGGVGLGAVGTTRLFKMKRRFVLVNGTSYTFQVGCYSALGAATTTVAGSATGPSWLTVTRS